MRNRALLTAGSLLTLISANFLAGCGSDDGDGSLFPRIPDTDGGAEDASNDRSSDVDGNGDAQGEAAPDGGDEADSSHDAGTDGDVDAACPAISFVLPSDGATLTEEDDADRDCSDGVQYDVVVATSAPDGTAATLNGANAHLDAVVSDAVAKFSGVSFPIGDTTLSVQVGTSSKCNATAHVTAACAGAPTCTISTPALSATHPALAQGDDVAAPGNPFQAAFEITTDAEDGQQVLLQVDDGVIYPATVSGGKATYAGITLSPDGEHEVKATCTATGGTSTDVKSFPVDSAPPDLTISGVTDGKHFGPSDDSDPDTEGLQFQICGATSAADALDVTQGPSPNPNNYCVAIGTSNRTCVPARAATGSGACVTVTCPGGAPFDLKVALYDAAGNAATRKIQAVSCATGTPSVQVVDPIATLDNDVSTRILAANQPQSRRDNDASKSGAQYDVVACTDSPTGKATLKLGLADGTLSPWKTPVDVAAAQPADRCPAGHGYVARFAGVTLPESAEDNGGNLQAMTRLVVEVEDESRAIGTSPPVDVWVDSAEPTLQPSGADPICGKFFQGTGEVTSNVVLIATAIPVGLTVANSSGTQSYTATKFDSNGNQVTFSSVKFAHGDNEVSASVSEPSGNAASLPSSCVATVGNPPIVTWASPAAGTSKLNASNDANASAPGWQGVLKACVDAATFAADPAATIQFSTAAGGPIGGALPLDSSGCASTSATVPEGDTVKLTATTSDVDGKGIGTSSLTLAVDVNPPAAVTSLTASVLDRRQTKFRLTWVAPADVGPKPAWAYDVRWSKKPIASAADFAAATQVPYTGSPAAPGGLDGIDVGNLTIQNDYYFAVVTKDKADNQSARVATGPVKATFKETVLNGSSGEMLGYDLDGSSDLNGDGYSDLVVGAYAGKNAYIYFGSATGFKSKPDITLAGSVSEFGIAARVVGDIDSDGLSDVAVGSDNEQKVYIFLGKTLSALTSFPATLAAENADAVIGTDAAADPKLAGSYFGTPVTPIGDFNGDGADDFAVTAVYYDGGRGYVGIVYGVPEGRSFPTSVVFPTDTGTNPPKAVAIKGGSTAQSNGGWFGWQIVGMGSLYPGQGSTIVVGAPRWNSKMGRLYAFPGSLSGVLDADTASQSTIDGTASSLLGSGLAFLGPISSGTGLLTGAPWTTPSGSVRVYAGSASSGPFANLSATLTNSNAGGASDAFGYTIETGAFSRSTATASFIGDTAPDVAISGQNENGAAPRVYIVDGRRLSASFDVVSGADVVYPFPSYWVRGAFRPSAIKDLDKDGYGDLAFGENPSSGTKDGHVLVLW